ncbi:MAG: SsrA-binding protein SmpB [Rhodobacteraceae bacterium]|nr:SsrA-binding protein SmpB [Paracoccaceae bacterium]
MAEKPTQKNFRVVAENRRARFDFMIMDEIECGMVLVGSEVKSLRAGQASIVESYAAVEDGELWLINGSISPYSKSSAFNHDDRRKRKLLVRQRELAKLWSATKREGFTLVPMRLFFNHKGIAKLKIGIARGRKRVDKRQLQRRRDWQREQARLLRERG